MQLVKEIDQVCQEQGIPYALCGRTAGCVMKYEKFTTQCQEFHIMLLAKDMLKLKNALLKKNVENRAVEDLSGNEMLAQNCMRYVDTGTTLIDRENPVKYQALGVAVTIFPLFSRESSKWVKALEYGMFYLNGGASYSRYSVQEKIGKCISATRKVQGLFGQKWIAKKVYGVLKKEQNRNIGDKVYLQYESNKKTAVSAKAVIETKRVHFEGIETSVSADYEEHLRKLYGKGWRKKAEEPLSTANRISVISDADKSYKEYLSEFDAEGIDIRRLQDDNLDYHDWYADSFRYWEDIVNHKYSYAKRSVERIDLYCAYKDQMDEMRRAASEKNIGKLQEMLEPYMAATKKYFKRNMGFFINQEIFDHASMVWKANKEDGYAAQVYDLVPEIYKKEDIAEFLSRYDCK